ncbi:MAG: ABC transporter permease [Thermomicrobiales bacterium]
MVRFCSRRLAQSLPLLLLVTFVAFGLQTLAPVDPARMALTAGSTGVTVSNEQLAAKRAELGLDRPVWRRYLSWVSGTIRFDFGNSYQSNRSVGLLMRERLLASVALAGLAWGISLAISIPLGLLIASRSGTWLDHAARFVTLTGASMPAFWIGLLGIWLFAAKLQWVPALGSFTPRGIILPALVLSLLPLSRLTRMVRATAIEEHRRDFVTVARSKGLASSTIWRRHIAPNAIAPLISVIGLDLANLFAGAAVIESVFSWPGIGRLSVDAAATSDLPILMALILIVGITTVALNLAADIAAALIDPRLRGGG